MINRVQAIVIAFLVLAWIGAVILVLATSVYDQPLAPLGSNQRVGEFVLVAGLTAFIAILSAGVVRRWRWVFWLILVAFGLSILQVPATVLEVRGRVATGLPLWYVFARARVAVIQFIITVRMLRLYKVSGVWGQGKGDVSG